MYDEAQGLGESVRQVKNRIGQMKSLMEQRRVERAMQVDFLVERFCFEFNVGRRG